MAQANYFRQFDLCAGRLSIGRPMPQNCTDCGQPTYRPPQAKRCSRCNLVARAAQKRSAAAAFYSKHGAGYFTKYKYPDKVLAWREKVGKGHFAAKARARYAADPEAGRQRARDAYVKDPVRAIQNQREYAARNPEVIRRRKKAWDAANPEHRREYQRRDYQDQPEKTLARQHRRRARLAGSKSVGVTPEAWSQICAAFDFRCAYCFGAKPLTRDHVVAISRGGKDEPSNVVPACKSCNSSKGARTLRIWLDVRIA